MDGGTAAASAAANDAAPGTSGGVRQRRGNNNGNTSTGAAGQQPRMRTQHTVPPNAVPTVWTMTRSVLLPVVVITLGTFVGAMLLGKAQTLAVAALIATLTSALIVRFALQLSAVAAQHPQLRRVHRLTGERAAYVRTSQRLAMMDRDFTAADYEMLLDLDNNSTRLRRFLEGASQEYIDRLPTFLYECEGDTNSSNAKCTSTSEANKKKEKKLANVIHSADNLLSLGGSSESETSSISISAPASSSSGLGVAAANTSDINTNTDEDNNITSAADVTNAGTVASFQQGSNPELGGESRKQCAICLEDFEYGQKIRVLPCFHRFMAGCIDPWLLEQARCPICKCSITS